MSVKQFWHKRRVLITGASGFIGSWLTLSLLEREAEVVILAKGKIKNSLLTAKALKKIKATAKADITDFSKTKEVFKRYKPDTCFHLAGQSIVSIANESPFPTFDANIKGTWNILEAAR
ncbi:NAD-dependent epimerase/dehydratase family protein, partial [bacterium]